MPAAPSLAHRLLDQAFNLGNLAIVDDLVSVDAPAHMPGWGIPANRLGLKQMIANLRAAFPDLHCAVDDEIEGESRSVALWTLRGTQHGAFSGNPPTGRQVEVQGFIYAHTNNRQITESWLMIDQLSMLQQIGLVPRL